MNSMFYNCKGLEEIHLSSFDTSSLKNGINMFKDCVNVQYIDFEKYDERNNQYVISVVDSLDKIVENIVICIKENINIVTNLKDEIDKKLCPTIDCSGDWRAHQKKIIPILNICALNCSGFKYEYNHRCYSTCPEGVDFCSPEDDISTNIISINKQEEQNISPSTNSISTNNKEEQNISPSTNKESFSSILTKNDQISTHIPNINVEEDRTTESIKEVNSLTSVPIIDKSSSHILDSSYYLDNTEKINVAIYNITGQSNEEIYLKIISDLIFKFVSSKESDIVIEGIENYLYQMITSEKERDILRKIMNNTNQLSNIDLGECENILKDHYHIDRNVSLIILKFEKVSNNSSERAIQYEVYEPFNLTKLDLSPCNDVKIDIYTHVELSEELLNLYNEMKKNGYDLFDINSAFYRDICTPYTSPNGTDVLLDDRISYYFHNNELVCQSNCEFSDYSIESQLLKCECDVSNSQIKTREITKLSKKVVYDSFIDSLKFSNYKVLYCYKLAFHINSVTVNKGSIIAIILFCFYFLFFLLYCYEGYLPFKIDVARYIFRRKKSDNAELIEYKYHNEKMIENQDKNNFFLDPLKSKKNKFGVGQSSKSLISGKTPKKLSKFKNIPRKKNSNAIQSNLTRNRPISIVNRNGNSDETMDLKEQEKLDNFELNNLEYDDAIRRDKRSYLNTYWSILKREHLIIFTFFAKNDHNLFYVKLARFIFLFCTDMTLNVFFFADETMHKTFLDYGKYNFLQHIPQIIYSTVATQLVEVFLCFLSMTDTHYYEIKTIEYKDRYKIFQILKCVKRKLIAFFVFTFLLFAFYWYAIACFCAVYVNTQSAFIKDSVTSFALGLLYPLILYLFPVLFRIISLRASKANLSCLYKLSEVIPFF